MTAALALFANGTFFDSALSMTNETAEDIFHRICGEWLFPFRQFATYPENHCNYYRVDGYSRNVTQEGRESIYAGAVANIMYSHLEPLNLGH